MKNSFKSGKDKFFVELIKPSHYDNDGYVIQWWRSFSISNSLSCLYSLTLDSAERKNPGRRCRNHREPSRRVQHRNPYTGDNPENSAKRKPGSNCPCRSSDQPVSQVCRHRPLLSGSQHPRCHRRLPRERCHRRADGNPSGCPESPGHGYHSLLRRGGGAP